MTRSKVGRDGPRCGARLRQSDGTCTQVAGWGTDHVGAGPCRLHGGSTRSVSKGAHRVLLDREARKALADFDLEPVTNPLEALQQHAAEVMSLRNYLRDQVSRLEALRYEGGSGEQVRAELAAYQAALRDTTAVLTAMARLDLDDRIVKINTRISEQQAELVVQAVRATLAALDLSAEQKMRANGIIARELRALSNEAGGRM